MKTAINRKLESDSPAPEIPRTEANRREVVELLRLAGPIMLSQIGFVTMGVIDTVVVGHHSAEALAAVAAGNVYHWTLLVVGMGVLFALDPLISQAHGANDQSAIRAWLHYALVIATALSAIFFVAFQFAAPVLRYFNQPATIIPATSEFVLALAPGLWPCFIFTVFRQALQATNRTAPALLAIAIANIANLVLDYVLVFGYLGFPEMGATGAGIATTLCRFLMVGILFYSGRHALLPYFAGGIQWGRLRDYAHFLGLGIPIGIQLGLETWAFMGISLIMGKIGIAELAGHQIATQLSSLLFMIPFGLGSAAGIRVGQAIGKQNQQEARIAANVSLTLGILGLGAISLGVAIFAVPLAGAFTSEIEVARMAAQFFPILALFQICDGVQGIGCGILRGAADTRTPAAIVFIGYWGVAVPIGYLMALPLRVGPTGLWWGLAIGLAVTAGLVIWRLRRISTISSQSSFSRTA